MDCKAFWVPRWTYLGRCLELNPTDVTKAHNVELVIFNNLLPNVAERNLLLNECHFTTFRDISRHVAPC